MDSHAATNEDGLEDPGLLLNREISWLAFNQRVLDQARDPHWPLLQRIKFLAIFGSNLDEFFMIRVSGLHDQLASHVQLSASDGPSVEAQLARIREVVVELSRAASELWATELAPELARAGIRVQKLDTLSEQQLREARTHFRKHVFPVLTPLAVDPLHPFPFLSNLSLSLAVEAEDPETLERRFARVKVPESLGRFVPLEASSSAPATGPRETVLVPLEELIARNLSDLFPGMRVTGSWPFRVTRDMDLEILEDEAEDLLALVDREVRRRRFGAAVRLEVDSTTPQRIRALLLEKLELDAVDLYESEGLLGFQSLFALAQLPRAELQEAPFRPRTPPGFEPGTAPFELLARGDVLLHHPYDSFNPVLELLRAAAGDPDVLAIKMTLYRAGKNSEAVGILIRAAESGKQVAVSIELQARFDEENNIVWARALERAGAHVFYGAPGLKTHAKALLIVRREHDGLRRYVHLSTGNYNASTAKLYTDMALLTTDPEFGEDVSELFNTLSGFSKDVAYRVLAVAPDGLRPRLLQKIAEQTRRAEAGEPARIFAKLNALVDPGIIRALYRASRAGVTIDLVVRGVCCLRPGVDGVSENIRVLSLVGRFLEHERVYAFGPPGQEEFFLSSADWMPRNLDRRVEALFPIRDPRLCERIRRETVQPLDHDNFRVYEMDPAGGYVRRQPAAGVGSVDAQHYACERVQELDAPASSGPGVAPSGQDLARPSQSMAKTYSSVMRLGALPVAAAGSRLTELESLKQ
jgi:polyphosphate kinase